MFLGFIVSSKGVERNPKKIKAIVDWPLPTNIHEVLRCEASMEWQPSIGALFEISAPLWP